MAAVGRSLLVAHRAARRFHLRLAGRFQGLGVGRGSQAKCLLDFAQPLQDPCAKIAARVAERAKPQLCVVPVLAACILVVPRGAAGRAAERVGLAGIEPADTRVKRLQQAAAQDTSAQRG